MDSSVLVSADRQRRNIPKSSAWFSRFLQLEQRMIVDIADLTGRVNGLTRREEWLGVYEPQLSDSDASLHISRLWTMGSVPASTVYLRDLMTVMV